MAPIIIFLSFIPEKSIEAKMEEKLHLNSELKRKIRDYGNVIAKYGQFSLNDN